MIELIEAAWQRKGALFYLVLVPLSWLFSGITALRRRAYQTGILKSYKLAVPVIVVGNITVGGNGKTPVVMWLVEQLREHGFTPAVISRGYGGSATAPTSVHANSSVAAVGDEPLLIAKRCACPVFVGVNRVAAGEALLKAHPNCNVIISDDGLQHYRLKRDIEIAVINSDALEAAWLLPAGPMREPSSRLNSVDAIIYNGKNTLAFTSKSAFEMHLVGERFYNLQDENILARAADFGQKTVKAMAGIGKPMRFFEHLSNLGLTFASVSFGDHHPFSQKELAEIECDALIMTEKDAVKCKPFAQAHHWVLPVQAKIDKDLMPLILHKLKSAH